MKTMRFITAVICILLTTTLFSANIWKDDFNVIQNWYDNKTDKSFNAVIIPGKKKGSAILQQKGQGNWGKVAYVVTDIDLNKFYIVRIKVDDVDKSGDYKVLAISQDWSDNYVIIDRGNGKGVYEGNIKEVTGWSGKRTFNIVLVVEGKGKKVEIDWIELSEEKEPENN